MDIQHFVFTLTCVFITFTAGQEITIRTPSVVQNSEGRCLFPDSLTVDLLRPGQDSAWSIRLRQDIVLPVVRSVYLMADSESRDMQEHRFVDERHDGVQGFHNHTHGAAFTVKCVRDFQGRQLYLLEGSVFLEQQKYRVTPSLSWQRRAMAFPSYTTNVYIMEETSDFKAGSGMMQRPSSNDQTQQIAQTPAASRYRRAVTSPVTYNIDILPVIDYTLYSRFSISNNGNLTKTIPVIVDYMDSLFTAVSMRLDTLNLQNRTLKIRLVQPVMLTNSTQAPYNSSHFTLDAGVSRLNASLLLSLFKKWLTTTKNLPVYDHAMFITATSIYGGGDSGIKFNITKGLAYVSSLCHGNGESSSLIEDKGAYQSEGVAAHELAHSFGSLHDGESNACSSSDRYIMADSTYPETPANAYNPWVFSSCSSASIVAYLNNLEQNATLLQKCLLNANGSIELGVFHTVSALDQCKIFYGNESFVCLNIDVLSFDKVCDEFYCHKPGTANTCERMEAATGTCCGTQKKCMRGQCVSAEEGACLLNGSCPFGDQPGIIVDGKTCAQLESTYCYNANIELKCCASCRANRTEKPGCVYGDKQLGCKASECGSKFSSGVYKDVLYDNVCCGTCTGIKGCVDTILYIQEGTRVNNYTCHDYIVTRGNEGICYQVNILQDACCLSCENARDAASPECPWRDKENCTALLDKGPGYTCKQSFWQDCCYTCGLYNPTTTTTTTMPTPKTSTTATTKTTMPTTKTSTTATTKTTMPTTKTSTTIITMKATAKTASSATQTAQTTNSTRGSSSTTTTKRPVKSACNPLFKKCSACMNAVSVQLLCVLLSLCTRLVNWLSS